MAGDGAAGATASPDTVDAFMSLVEAGWDSRGGPPSARAAHHRGGASRRRERAPPPCIWARCSPSDERRYLTCDATCEVWFERHGQVIGSGRATRTDQPPAASRARAPRPLLRGPRLRATRGLHAHHIRHWEDGGPTELVNLVLVCPYHHRLHHRGLITITGPAHHLVVTDAAGRPLSGIAGPPSDDNPRPRSHRAPDPPANAPTGGGTNHSNRNHHLQSTSRRSSSSAP